MNIQTFDTKPVAIPIKKIIRENNFTRTFIFEYPLMSKPGQFVMLWLPGFDENPFSIAYDDKKEFALTVCNVGDATGALFTLSERDLVGIRGPFGTSYEFKPKEKLALVAGGYGVAPMYFVAQEALKLACEVEFIIGARNSDLVLYVEKIVGLEDVRLHVATDDGSMGFKGYNTQLLANILLKKTVDKIFACGPEKMEWAVGLVADDFGLPCFLSVEKYMKCGFGVCGQCAIDDSGETVCTKGPVMSWDYLKKMPEFGKYHRDAQGKKHYF